MTPQESIETKLCAHCQQEKPLAEFKRRSGKRRGATARRGMCKACRKQLKDSGVDVESLDEESAMPATDVVKGAEDEASVPSKKKRKRRKRKSKKKTAELAAVETDVAEGTESALAVPEEPEQLQALPERLEEEETPKKTKKKRKQRKRKSKKQDSEVFLDADEDVVATVEADVDAHQDLESGENGEEEPAPKKKRKRKRRKKKKAAEGESVSLAPARVPFVPPEIPLEKLRAIGLKPTWGGYIRMRGKTDNGRKWYQEIDTYLAYVLVTEHAAEVVNRHTIRRIYSNKEFRKLILERDNYTCHFCKQYGDTIDHLLPRAKGGHTTPDNCVCACNLCNQSKADKDLEDFMNILELG